LIRMTLCIRGRSVLVRTLVFGLVTVVSLIPEMPPVPVVLAATLQFCGRAWNRLIAMASLRRQQATRDELPGSGPNRAGIRRLPGDLNWNVNGERSSRFSLRILHVTIPSSTEDR
jgi:hypothetical protein